jgi:hypothetical protein
VQHPLLGVDSLARGHGVQDLLKSRLDLGPLIVERHWNKRGSQNTQHAGHWPPKHETRERSRQIDGCAVGPRPSPRTSPEKKKKREARGRSARRRGPRGASREGGARGPFCVCIVARSRRRRSSSLWGSLSLRVLLKRGNSPKLKERRKKEEGGKTKGKKEETEQQKKEFFSAFFLSLVRARTERKQRAGSKSAQARGSSRSLASSPTLLSLSEAARGPVGAAQLVSGRVQLRRLSLRPTLVSPCPLLSLLGARVAGRAQEEVGTAPGERQSGLAARPPLERAATDDEYHVGRGKLPHLPIFVRVGLRPLRLHVRGRVARGAGEPRDRGAHGLADHLSPEGSPVQRGMCFLCAKETPFPLPFFPSPKKKHSCSPC